MASSRYVIGPIFALLPRQRPSVRRSLAAISRKHCRRRLSTALTLKDRVSRSAIGDTTTVQLVHDLAVRIRLAEPSDALDVARVHVRSWRVGYRGLVPDDYLDRLSAEERVDPT